jgi:hypothetical protein
LRSRFILVDADINCRSWVFWKSAKCRSIINELDLGVSYCHVLTVSAVSLPPATTAVFRMAEGTP